MSKIEVTTPITRRSLINKTKDRLIDLIMMMTDWLDHREKRIATLEKALAQAAETNLQLRTIEAPCVLNGVSRDHIGQECIVFGGYYPGEILGWASEYPELAEWLRAWLGAGDAKKE